MRYRLSPGLLGLVLTMMTRTLQAESLQGTVTGELQAPLTQASTAPGEGAPRRLERYRPDVTRGPALTAGSLESFRKRLRERLASTPPPPPGLRPMRTDLDVARPRPGRDLTARPADFMDPGTPIVSDAAIPEWSTDLPKDRGFAAAPIGPNRPSGNDGWEPAPVADYKDPAINAALDERLRAPGRMPAHPDHGNLAHPMPPTFADGPVGSPIAGRPGIDRPTDVPVHPHDVVGMPRPLPRGDVSILPYPAPDPALGRGIVPPRGGEGRADPDVVGHAPGVTGSGYRDPLGIPAPVDPAEPAVVAATGEVTSITADLASDAILPAATIDLPAPPPGMARRRVPPDVRARHDGSR